VHNTSNPYFVLWFHIKHHEHRRLVYESIILHVFEKINRFLKIFLEIFSSTIGDWFSARLSVIRQINQFRAATKGSLFWARRALYAKQTYLAQ